MNNLLQQGNHTANERTYQVVMPLDLGIRIPMKDSVRTLIEVTERLDYSSLYRAYKRREKADQATPKQMFQLFILGFVNREFSTRELSKACEYDIRFMWILGDRKAPSHSRFARFFAQRLQGDVMADLFYQLIRMLHEQMEITGENALTDGTKIEANASRYSFVWNKTVSKNAEKLKAKQETLVEELRNAYPCMLAEITEALAVLEKLNEMWQASGQEAVHGRGKRKSELQRQIEALSENVEKEQAYEASKEILGERGSYSKTDHDATFMRMKEDHMKNGQLKPAYNVQLAVEGEYIVGLDAVADRNDAYALIPLLEKMEKGSGIKYRNIVADAGYESEENYTRLEERGQIAYIKPQNYEKRKKRSYRENPFLRENMLYDEAADAYQCPAGKWLKHEKDAQRESKSGFQQTISIYVAEGCASCPMKSKCTKAKEQRRIEVSKRFSQQRAQSHERITSEKGILLRVNRSIQSEGTFGVLKENWQFRRFLRRGKSNIMTELMLYCFAFNVAKLHAKRIQGRLKSQLIIPKTA